MENVSSNVMDALPLSVRERLMHIERCLFWKGEVGRADLVDTFDVRQVQAARDFRLYIENFPRNMAYSRQRRRYLVQPSFTPGLITPKTLDEFVDIPSEHVPVARWPLPLRRATPEVLLAMVTAVRERQKIEVQYQSMTGSGPQWRWLSPHAFAHDSERWHVRAYCHMREQFLDFVLGRILDTRSVEKSSIDPAEDMQWNTHIDVLVTPNPELEPEQRIAVGAEYELPEDLDLILHLRQAMLFYVQAKFDVGSKEEPAARQLFVSRLGNTDRTS